MLPRKVKSNGKVYRLKINSRQKFMCPDKETWTIAWVAEDDTYLMEFVDDSFLRGCLRASKWIRKKDNGYNVTF